MLITIFLKNILLNSVMIKVNPTQYIYYALGNSEQDKLIFKNIHKLWMIVHNHVGYEKDDLELHMVGIQLLCVWRRRWRHTILHT